MAEAKLVLHHDDPPCAARLESYGFCPKCNCHPDTQSTATYCYCPVCDVKLEYLRCPLCRKIFEMPGK